jgi:methionine synthase I (cobalamin-dependent)
MLVSSSDGILSNITFEQLAQICEQARALVDRAPTFDPRTMQDLLELRAAIAGIQRVRAGCRVPDQAQPTLITEGRMLLGTDIPLAPRSKRCA